MCPGIITEFPRATSDGGSCLQHSSEPQRLLTHKFLPEDSGWLADSIAARLSKVRRSMWGFVRNLPPRRRVRAARKTELETLKRFQFWRRFQLKALLRFQFQCISWRRFNVSSSNALETFQRFQLERFQLKAVSSMSLIHPPTGDNKEK